VTDRDYDEIAKRHSDIPQDGFDFVPADRSYEGHGWGRGPLSFQIGLVPTKERVAIYSVQAGVVEVYGYFSSPESAAAATAVIDIVVGITDAN
jgi:hypothetical protein